MNTEKTYQNCYRKPNGDLIMGSKVSNKALAVILANLSPLGKYVETIVLEDCGECSTGVIINLVPEIKEKK